MRYTESSPVIETRIIETSLAGDATFPFVLEFYYQNRKLSKSELQQILDGFQTRGISPQFYSSDQSRQKLFHLVNKSNIRSQFAQIVPERLPPRGGDPGELTDQYVEWTGYGGGVLQDFLDHNRADVSDQAYFKLKHKLGNRAFRREWTRRHAHNELSVRFLHGLKRFDQAGRAYSVISAAADDLGGGGYQQAFDRASLTAIRDATQVFYITKACEVLVTGLSVNPWVAGFAGVAMYVGTNSTFDLFFGLNEPTRVPHSISFPAVPVKLTPDFIQTVMKLHADNLIPVNLESKRTTEESKGVDPLFYNRSILERLTAERSELSRNLWRKQDKDIPLTTPSPNKALAVGLLQFVSDPTAYRQWSTSDSIRMSLYSPLAYVPPTEDPTSGQFWLRGRELGYTFSLGKNYNGSVSVDLASVLNLLRYGYQKIKEWRLPEHKKIQLDVLHYAEKYLKSPSSKRLAQLRNLTDRCFELNTADSNVMSTTKFIRYALESQDKEGLAALLKRDYDGTAKLVEGYRRDLIGSPITYQANEHRFPYEDKTHYLHAVELYQTGKPREGLAEIDRAIELHQLNKPRDLLEESYMHHQQNDDLFQKLKHDLLLQQALQSKSTKDADALIQFQQGKISVSQNLSARRQMADDFKALGKHALEIQYREGICKSPQANAEDFLQFGQVQYAHGSKQEAVDTYKIFLEKTPYKNSKTAYEARVKIREYYLENDLTQPAFEIGKTIVQHACPLEEYYKFGGQAAKYGHRDEAIAAYVTYVHQNKITPESPKEVRENYFKSARYLGKQFAEDSPGEALYYYKECLIIKPDDLESLQECEKIYVKHGTAEQLLELHQQHATHINYAATRVKEIATYLRHQVIYDRAEGTGMLVQLFTGLRLRNSNLDKSSRKALSAADFGLTMTLQGLLPWLRQRNLPMGINPKGHNWMKTGAVSTAALFHLLQEFEALGLSPEDARTLSTGIEAGFLGTDGLSSLPQLGQQAQQIWDGMKAIVNFARSNPTFSDISSLFVLPPDKPFSCEDLMQNYGDQVLGYMATMSLALRSYEFYCRTSGSQLPESQAYYVTRNAVGFTPPALIIAGKLGLTIAGVKAGAAAAERVLVG